MNARQLLIYFFFSMTCMVSCKLVAQENLSLEDALKRAEENNIFIQKSRAGVQITEADLEMTKGLYLPQIQFSETFVMTNDPLQSFGLLLKQEIVEQSDFNPSQLNAPDVITNFNTRLDIQQPLLNFDKMEEKKALLQKINSENLMLERMIQGVYLEVKKTYFSLYLGEKSLEIIQTALEAAKENFRLSQDNLEQGYIQKADVLAAEVRVLELENQIKDIEEQILSARAHLNYLMNNEDEAQFILSDSLRQEVLFLEEGITISEERSDFQAIRTGIQAQETLLSAQDKRFLPNLNAFGAFEFNDDIPFGVNANNWIVGVQLQWNIFDGYNRQASKQKIMAEIKETELAYDDQLAKSKIELEKGLRQLRLTYEKLELSELAVKQAEESLRIRKDRYQQGLEKTSDLLNAEALLSKQKLTHLQNIFAYNMAIFYLEFLLETE